MKVLMVNGSAKAAGCTFTALTEVGKALNEEGIDYEIFQLGAGPLRDCIGCLQCSDKGCVFDDDKVNEFLQKAREADGFVFGSPVYYAHPSGVSSRSWTEPFMRAADIVRAAPLRANPGRRSSLRAAAARRLPWTSSTSTSRSPPCPSSARPIGTWCTAASRRTSSKIRRASRPCTIWGTTWRGCSKTCTKASLRRRRARAPTLSAEVIYVS